MKLNMDCIRDILLCVEKNTSLRQRCCFMDEEQMEAVCCAMGEDEEAIPRYQEELQERRGYTNEMLFYHVRYCEDAELIRTERNSSTYKIVVSDLTVKGHEFTANIRETKNWKAVKSVLKSAGSMAMEAAIEAAKAVVSASVQKYLG